VTATDSPAVARLRENLRYASDFPSGHVDEVEAVLAELDRLRATVIALETPQEARPSTESSSTGAGGSAERLRGAADAIERRTGGCVFVDCGKSGCPAVHANAAAGLAAPLAAWLRERATYSDAVGFCNDREALAVADAILGAAR
jgi:hypothetical protein